MKIEKMSIKGFEHEQIRQSKDNEVSEISKKKAN